MTGNSVRRAGERGSSAVEFSLVVAAMAAMIVAVVMGAGGILRSVFVDGCDGLAEQVASSTCPDPDADDTTAQDEAPDRSIGAIDDWGNRYGAASIRL